jgi:hypothetical protein
MLSSSISWDIHKRMVSKPLDQHPRNFTDWGSNVCLKVWNESSERGEI